MVTALFLATTVVAEDLSPTQTGVRAGFSTGGMQEYFFQTEAFAQWETPWHWDLGNDWSIRTSVEARLGSISGGGDTGVEGCIGPNARVGRQGFPVYLDLGAGIGGISRHKYGDENLGGPLQGFSHAGIGVELGRNIEVGYRYHHMSNANIYDTNPGVNLHMFTIQYRF